MEVGTGTWVKAAGSGVGRTGQDVTVPPWAIALGAASPYARGVAFKLRDRGCDALDLLVRFKEAVDQLPLRLCDVPACECCGKLDNFFDYLS